jgi:hypothetical protein
MYVGTSDGVSVIDINTLEVLSFDDPSAEKLFRVRDFLEFEGQVYVITYNTGIHKLQQKRNQWDLLKVNDHTFIYSFLWIMTASSAVTKSILPGTAFPNI